MSERRPLIAVFGSAMAREGDAVHTLAHDVGRALARHGADVMTGGYGGAMEACSRGAAEAGAHVVGVTVEIFEARGPVNPWVRERIHTRTLFERLATLVERADGFVVVPGSVGTLAELFLTWNLLAARTLRGQPLVLVGEPWAEVLRAHRQPDLVHPELFDLVRVARDADEAARLALGRAPAEPA